MLSPKTHFWVPMCLVSKMVAPGKTCSLISVIDTSSYGQDCIMLPVLVMVAMLLQFKTFMQGHKNVLGHEK